MAGQTFIEHTHTVLINKAGLKAVSKQSLAIGGRLQIAVPSRQRVSWATVAWLGEKNADGQEVGIALDQADDFWGIRFPPDSPESNPAQSAVQQQGANSMPESLVLQGNVRARTHQDQQASHSGKSEALAGSSEKLSGALRELAEAPIRAVLQDALKQLQTQIEDVRSNACNHFAAELQLQVDELLSAAIQRTEAHIAEMTAQAQRDWEQRIEALGSSSRERLETHLAEQEQRGIECADKLRRDLAQRLSAASQLLARD